MLGGRDRPALDGSNKKTRTQKDSAKRNHLKFPRRHAEILAPPQKDNYGKPKAKSDRRMHVRRGALSCPRTTQRYLLPLPRLPTPHRRSAGLVRRLSDERNQVVGRCAENL
jgi:hypothetical protein